jgi:hypothetical protein
MSIQVAESKGRKAPKVLEKLSIGPKMGGGHNVTHHYSGYGPGSEPKEYSFNAKGVGKGGEHIIAHLTKHAGLPEMEGQEGGEEEVAEEGEAAR